MGVLLCWKWGWFSKFWVDFGVHQSFRWLGSGRAWGALALGMARALRLQYLHIFNWIWGNFAVLQHSGFDRPQLCHVLQPDSFSPAQG